MTAAALGCRTAQTCICLPSLLLNVFDPDQIAPMVFFPIRYQGVVCSGPCIGSARGDEAQDVPHGVSGDLRIKVPRGNTESQPDCRAISRRVPLALAVLGVDIAQGAAFQFAEVVKTSSLGGCGRSRNIHRPS